MPMSGARPNEPRECAGYGSGPDAAVQLGGVQLEHEEQVGDRGIGVHAGTGALQSDRARRRRRGGRAHGPDAPIASIWRRLTLLFISHNRLHRNVAIDQHLVERVAGDLQNDGRAGTAGGHGSGEWHVRPGAEAGDSGRPLQHR